jgi:hypothetical protein
MSNEEKNTTDSKERTPPASSDNMRSYDRLSDTLDGKLLDMNLKVLGLLASILIRPLAACTEVMFRRNLGERYFNVTTTILSVFIWSAAELFSYFGRGIQLDFFQKIGCGRLGAWLAVHSNPKIITVLIGLAFWWSASTNLDQSRKRQAKGIPWYSMSRGESVFGNESPFWNDFIPLVIGIVLFAYSPVSGLFFIASRAAGYFLFLKEQQSHYARYLDDMDAKILSSQLQAALKGEKDPGETQGLFCPLPARIKGEQRDEVVRVSASVLARSAARRAESVATGPSVVAEIPLLQVAPDSPLGKMAEAERRRQTVAQKQMTPEEIKKLSDLAVSIRRYFIRGFVVLVCGVIVYGIFHLIKSPKNISAPTLGSNSTPAATVSADVLPPVRTNAVSINQLAFAQLTNTVAVEMAKIEKFKSDTRVSVVDAYARIIELPNENTKSSLSQEADKIANDADEIIQKQGEYLASVVSPFFSAQNKPNLNPEEALKSVQTNLPIMEKTRQLIFQRFDYFQKILEKAAPTRKHSLF